MRRRFPRMLVTVTGVVAMTGVCSAASAPPRPLSDLVHLSAERLVLADSVAAAKYGTSQPIEDHAREGQVLDRAARQADSMGLDPQQVRRVFADQIEANKVVQRGLTARWDRGDPPPPHHKPDMGPVRARIDQINTELLTTLQRSAPVRRSPVCSPVLTGEWASTGPFDALHHTALARSLPSVCGN